MEHTIHVHAGHSSPLDCNRARSPPHTRQHSQTQGSARWNKEIKETVGARFRSLDEFLGEELACVANLLLLKVGGHFG